MPRFSPSSLRVAALTLGTATLLWMVPAAPLTAQLQSSGLQAHLLAGVDGTDPGVHLAGGVGGGAMLHRWGGVEGVAMGGTGAGYRSVHLAAGPSLRLVHSERGELRSWAGLGWYRESLTGLPEGLGVEPRSTLTAAGGVLGRLPAGPVQLTAGVLFWSGSLDADGFARSSRSTGVRLVVGVGR